MEGLIGMNGMLDARNIRHAGPATGRNQNMASGDGFTPHKHAMRPRERRTSVHKGHARPGQQFGVHAV